MAATATIAKPRALPGVSWMHAVIQDLQPTPGRLNSALRIVLASVMALILMEALQMPFIGVGMYYIFLIGRDSPAVSLRSSLFSCGIIVLAIVVELAVIILTDNDPMARLLSVAAVAFVAGMIVVASNNPALGSSLGLIYCTVIALWESHAPADHLVKSSLYLVGSFMISLGSAVAVEYLFGDRNPTARLQEQRHLRYVALESMFRAYADNAPLAQRLEAAIRVSRIALAGQSGMIALYNSVVERNLDTGGLPIATRLRITMLAQLMDVAAAFGLQNQPDIDPGTRTRCALIADECKRIIPGLPPASENFPELGSQTADSLLDQVEGAIRAIVTMPSSVGSLKNRELVTVPSRKLPFFVPGAIRGREAVAFGLKISLCATFCYILYHALDWSGTATSVTTVLVAGLSSTAAMNQRLVFRALGSLIGGLILGLGATVFLFPHINSIGSLMIVEIVIAFLAAWIAGGPKFNYIGLQIAFSFYLVAFDGLSAPTELAPARDRFIGILIALAVMWLVFDQLWPMRTTAVMRRGFASVLRINADLLISLDSAEPHEDVIRQVETLRDQVGKIVAGLRSMNDSVPYEFGADREKHIWTGNVILRATLTSAALFWHQLAVLYSEADSAYLTNHDLQEMRRKLAAQIDAMAEAIGKNSAVSVNRADFITPAILANQRYGEYARNTAVRYDELQNFTATLNGLPPHGR